MLLNYERFPAFSVAVLWLQLRYISLYQQSDTIMCTLKLVGFTPVCCLVELPLSLFWRVKDENDLIFPCKSFCFLTVTWYDEVALCPSLSYLTEVQLETCHVADILQVCGNYKLMEESSIRRFLLHPTSLKHLTWAFSSVARPKFTGTWCMRSCPFISCKPLRFEFY